MPGVFLLGEPQLRTRDGECLSALEQRERFRDRFGTGHRQHMMHIPHGQKRRVRDVTVQAQRLQLRPVRLLVPDSDDERNGQSRIPGA
ncbi:hypothetical protein [Paenibacillus thiaminolyticus]|uniref:Uncharacterized protein n=1 Tax=Paenibacillus thiaminolyticus TaxID=49283 RepID=A0A3A3GNL6_PANTH|nr:hypothetical protein [Paenibacillus thiaminolyticus]RJG24542.1 hypothetical protein DQX05_09465 [Paenibacillus thiaminolyticus]